MGKHKEQVIENQEKILANQELIMDELGIDKPNPQRAAPPTDDPGNDAPKK